MDIEKKLKKLEKQVVKKPLKKFKYDDNETPTRLEPYSRDRFSLRNIEDFMPEEEGLEDDEDQ